MHHLMVRVVSPSFENWRKAVDYASGSMAEYGITAWRIYRDDDQPNAGLADFTVDEVSRAMEFFRTPIFQEANKMAAVIEREFYVAEKK